MSKDRSQYAGRWVACLHGKVIAQGGTPEQALRAAQSSRFKEKPEIVYMPTTDPLIFPSLLDTIRKLLPDGLDVFLVGGAVRNALLGRTSNDLDFAMQQDAIKTARHVADTLQANYYTLDHERDTGRVIVTQADGTRTIMDFAAFRGENLEADLQGRDFTINAIAMELGSLSLVDPLGGGIDLKEKRLRACSRSTFNDDPVRILRGVRLAGSFNLHILPETRQAMKAASRLLPDVSAERVRDELLHILGGPQPAASLRALDLLGALSALLPELVALKGIAQPDPHVYDVWDHTLSVLNHLDATLATLSPQFDPEKSNDLYRGLLSMRLGRYRKQLAEHLGKSFTIDRPLRGLLFLAALYHDVAKPVCKEKDEDGRPRFWGHDEQGANMLSERAHTLQLSNEEVHYLQTIIRHHMRVHYHANRLINEQKQPTRRAIYRFFRDTGAVGVDILLLALADFRATYEHTLSQEVWTACLDVCRLFMENWWEKPAESVRPPILLNGDDLMKECHLNPGPQIGMLLEAIREAQAMGNINSKEEALVFAKACLEEDPHNNKSQST